MEISRLNSGSVSYTHLRAHETDSYLVCRLLLEKWYQKHKRPFQAEEDKLDELIQDLMEKILLSEKEFEKIVGREKNAVSLQITQLGRQMQYRKDPEHQRPQIKNMKT